MTGSPEEVVVVLGGGGGGTGWGKEGLWLSDRLVSVLNSVEGLKDGSPTGPDGWGPGPEEERGSWWRVRTECGVYTREGYSITHDPPTVPTGHPSLLSSARGWLSRSETEALTLLWAVPLLSRSYCVVDVCVLPLSFVPLLRTPTRWV